MSGFELPGGSVAPCVTIPSPFISVELLVDSGCSDHFFADRHLFTSFDKNAKLPRFKVAAEHKIKPHGKGTVEFNFRTPEGEIVPMRLEGCYYDPTQPLNLLSMGSLLEAGLCRSPCFEDRTWDLTPATGNWVTACMRMSNKTYVIDTLPSPAATAGGSVRSPAQH
jgi:hypothetical protein